jgi:DNA sulfur modification protein DndB
VVLRAIGATGAELLKSEPDNWKERLKLLEEINWSKQNRDWEGVCMVANSVVSNRQARAATKAYIKNKLGLPLSEAETRALAPPAGARLVQAAE